MKRKKKLARTSENFVNKQDNKEAVLVPDVTVQGRDAGKDFAGARSWWRRGAVAGRCWQAVRAALVAKQAARRRRRKGDL